MQGGNLYSPDMACVRPMGKVNGTVAEFIDVFVDIARAAVRQAELVTSELGIRPVSVSEAPRGPLRSKQLPNTPLDVRVVGATRRSVVARSAYGLGFAPQ